MKNTFTPTAIEKILLAAIYIGFGILCFNIVMPIDNAVMLYDAKRFFNLSVVAIFSLLILLLPSLRQFILSRFFMLSRNAKRLITLFLILVFLSDAFNSNSWGSSFIYDLYFVGLILLIFFFLRCYSKDKSGYFFIGQIITIGLFLSVSVAFYYRVKLGLDVNYHTILSFVNPRFMNQVQVWLIIPLAYLAVIKQLRHKKNGITYTILLTLNISIAFTLDARGLLLSIISGYLLILILEKNSRWVWARLFAISLTCGGLMSLVFFKFLPLYVLGEQLDFPELRTSSSGRLALWESTLLSSSFWGHGGGSYVCDGFAFGHPHNSILTVLYHWGVFPAIIYISLSLILLYKVCLSSSRLNRILGVSVLTGLLYSLVSGVFVMPLSQLLAAMSFGAYWASSKPQSQIVFDVPRWKNFLLIMLASGVLASTTYVAYDRVNFYKNEDIYEIFKTEKLMVQNWIGHNCLKKTNRF